MRPCPQQGRLGEKTAVCIPGSEPAPDTDAAGALIPHFQPPDGERLTSEVFLIKHPEQTETHRRVRGSTGKGLPTRSCRLEPGPQVLSKHAQRGS